MSPRPPLIQGGGRFFAPVCPLLFYDVDQIIVSLDQLTLQHPSARGAGEDFLFERSIAEDGIRFPLVVTSLGPKLYLVLDGERRLAVLKALIERSGKSNRDARAVDCLLVDAKTDRERAFWRFVSNMHRPLDEDEAALLRPLVFGAESSVTPGCASVAPTSNLQAVDRMDSIITGLMNRRSAIRSSGRLIEAIEITRLYVLGHCGFQEAMDRMRKDLGDS